MPTPKPNNPPPGVIRPDWPAPSRVTALTTTRYRPAPDGARDDGFNLAMHADADPAVVAKNRRHLEAMLGLPGGPVWLEQVHGRDVVRIDGDTRGVPRADAAWTDTPGAVCAVLTADCLPVLLCDRHGREVAAVHGGWRGLQQGIIDRALQCFGGPASQLMAWLGPAIGADVYEVDDGVRDAFAGWNVDSAFSATRPGHWMLDLYAVAREQLNRAGVACVYGGDYCTYSQPERFFSYRREKQTGRMASLIWIEPEND